VIPWLLKAGRAKILIWTALLLVVTTLLDWATGHNVSLAALYILPTMLGAVVLGPAETVLFALFCSFIRSRFDVPGSLAEEVQRFVFAASAYFISGLFVTGLLRNHHQAMKHLSEIQTEQERRRETEEQLRVLAASSPATILTIDGNGTVLAANNAASKLLMIPPDRTLLGQTVGEYLPFLAEALQLDTSAVGLRTAAQCRGRRDNGEMFLANLWFSSYSTSEGKRLAAIVVDSSEDLRDREEQGLRQLFAGNRIATAAIAHEVRNFSEAMAMLCEDLRRRHALSQDESLRGLDSLVSGLEAIASLDLRSPSPEAIQEVPLQEVFDNLRIVVDPAWREIEGTIRWCLPEFLPLVWAEPHGLLQAFLNLTQNSHRAVQDAGVRELSITVVAEGQNVIARFEDSGPGIQSPENLFQPFQDGASGSGLGLYLSRFIVRSYGGELRFEPRPKGSCFVVELEAV
jgi:two-component system, LuxR family, sensor kinase FixL